MDSRLWLWLPNSYVATGSKTTSRSLFGFTRKKKSETVASNIDPGLDQMMNLVRSLKNKERPPPLSESLEAFKSFFAARRKTPTPVEEYQASVAMQTFKYIKENNANEDGFGLSKEELQFALRSLTYGGRDQDHKFRIEFAFLLFEEILLRKRVMGQEDGPVSAGKKSTVYFIQILTQCRESLRAREFVEKYWRGDLEEDGALAWKLVLKGLIRERKKEELVRTIEIMQQYSVPFDAGIQQSIICAYAQQGNMKAVKRWYMHPIAGDAAPTTRTKFSVLKCSLQHKELEWAQPVFESLLGDNPDKQSWDITFQWAAAKGRGADEIERMMQVMIRRNEEGGSPDRPDIESINGLISLANDANDPYNAERYIALAHKMGMQLDAETYLLQLDYRIKVGDLDGARAAYASLQGHEIPKQRDIPLLNKLVLALCQAKSPDHEAIMQYVEDLNERDARFEPETVAALSLLHLNRNETDDMINLLQKHAFHFGIDQRAAIRDVLVNYCLDRRNSTGKVWEAYLILIQIFNETDNGVRLKLMKEFFGRRRCDMATHVFGHMRQNILRERRPDAELYTQCLEGIGKLGDLGSTETIHNMLKLDSAVEPDTRLYNALMLAYTASGDPGRSIQFWDDIVYSREGPTYNSIRIALRACEIANFGEEKAREIWDRLQRLEIEITKDLYVDYIGALAGHGKTREAIRLVEGMKESIGEEVDVITLGTLYNATPSDMARDEVAAWAAEVYSEVWQEVVKLGRKRVRDRGLVYRIDRDIPA